MAWTGLSGGLSAIETPEAVGSFLLTQQLEQTALICAV